MADENSSWTETEEGISIYFVIFSSLLALVLILSKLLHDRPVLASFLPEAGMVILVGGFIIHLLVPPQIPNDDDNTDVATSLLSFSPTVFFVALLPPIIFNSGYHIRKDLFFRHATPICLFACLGTLVSAIVIALMLLVVVRLNLVGDFEPAFSELLTFGALISATDPVSTLAVFQSKRVDPHLFYLVFGESVLNDAVGLVLFNTFARFVKSNNEALTIIWAVFQFLLSFVISFSGSMLLGALFGMCSALLLKVVDMRRSTLLELSLYILIMYVPFLLAEMMHLSGIVTILFTGMSARRYVVPNLSAATEGNADIFFRLAAHVAETSIFLELGLSVFGVALGNFQWQFILWAILACLIARAANIYPIAFFYNRSLRPSEEEVEEEVFKEEDFIVKVEMEDIEQTASEGSDKKYTTKKSKTPFKRRDKKVPMNTAHMLWFSGLRGAVAYACVKMFPDTFGHKTPFVVTTMSIVLVTVFVLGGLTECVLTCLKIPTDVDEDDYMEIQGYGKGKRNHILTRFFAGFETRYIRKVVIRDFEEVCSFDDDEDRNAYRQHDQSVEVTRNEHLATLGTPQRKSLYDYGK